MEDKIFGELSYDYLWEGETTIHLYGEDYKITLGIEGEEDEEISELQRETYLMYKKKETEISSQIEKAIYEYYSSIFEDERDRNHVDMKQSVPEISNCQEMKTIINPIKFCIPELDADREVDLLFDCTWDIEMGMGIRIVNEEVVCAGIQNDVL